MSREDDLCKGEHAKIHKYTCRWCRAGASVCRCKCSPVCPYQINLLPHPIPSGVTNTGPLAPFIHSHATPCKYDPWPPRHSLSPSHSIVFPLSRRNPSRLKILLFTCSPKWTFHRIFAWFFHLELCQ